MRPHARSVRSARHRRIVALAGLSLANRLETGAGGGEAGVATGFGTVEFFQLRALNTTGNALLVGRTDTSDLGWAYYLTGANVLNFRARNGTTVLASSSGYTFTAADVGRLFCIVGSHDGANLRLSVSRRTTAPVAIAGYTPSAGPQYVGSVGGVGTPGAMFGWIAGCTFRGVPTDMDALMDEVRRTWLVPRAIAGATITHRWPLREQLQAVAAPTVPASVPDGHTAASVDTYTVAGSPTLVTIDPTQHGRRTSGVQGANAATRYSTAAGVAGQAGGFSVAFVARFDQSTSAVRIPFGKRNGGASGGWGFDSSGATRQLYFSATQGAGGFVSSAPYAFSTRQGGDPILVVGVHTGSAVQLFVDGVKVGADVAITGYSGSAAPMTFGSPNDGLYPDDAISGFAWGGGHVVLTAAQIAQMQVDLEATGRLVPPAGAFSHLYHPGDDIAAAGDTVPATVVNSIAPGTDNMARVGTGHVLARHVRRIFSYEDTPILYGAADFTDANYYEGTLENGGDAGGFWVAVKFAVTQQSGLISTTRVLASKAAATSGWDVRTSGTNSSVTMVCTNGAGEGALGGAGVINASDLGRVLLLVGQWDAAAQKIRVFFKRQEVGTGVARVGYTPNTLNPLRIGRSYADNIPAAGMTVYGVAVGLGSITDAEQKALHDNVMANQRMVGIPGRSSALLLDFTRAALENGGTLPNTISDYAGTNPVAKVGAPLPATQHAYAYGW